MRDRQFCSCSGVEDSVWIVWRCITRISDIIDQLALLTADGDSRHVGAAKCRHAGACRAGRKANATQASRQPRDSITGEAPATVLSTCLLVGAHLTHEDHRAGDVMQQVTSEVSSGTAGHCTQYATYALWWKIIADHNECSIHFFSDATDDFSWFTACWS